MSIEIGKTYLSNWGEEHKIHGKVRLKGKRNRDDAVYSDTLVWSLYCHFDKNTGKNPYGGSYLYDDLEGPVEPHIVWWENRIKEISEANSEDKLKLVAPNLSLMQKRIEFLKNGRKNWEDYS